jgi:hypothetical protein
MHRGCRLVSRSCLTILRPGVCSESTPGPSGGYTELSDRVPSPKQLLSDDTGTTDHDEFSASMARAHVTIQSLKGGVHFLPLVSRSVDSVDRDGHSARKDARRLASRDIRRLRALTPACCSRATPCRPGLAGYCTSRFAPLKYRSNRADRGTSCRFQPGNDPHQD